MKYGDRMDEQTDSSRRAELGYTTEYKINNLMNSQPSADHGSPFRFFSYTFPHQPGRDNIKIILSSLTASEKVLYMWHFKSPPSFDMKWNSCTDEHWFIWGSLWQGASVRYLSIHQHQILSPASETSAPHREAMLNCFLCFDFEWNIQNPFHNAFLT